ncbi:glycosyltransferase family 4 protein [Pseudomonas sp. CM25]|uniref:MraY family glycosyltransferase n=1 Tax=unclassified Pseudomonas TaxID=196821 RepID=UPI001554DE49|nr:MULTISPECIES: glycosyltransferase family 4 protein [unclassified Pseudomonas]NQD58577.1 glycosyltransferase family 4 protein [Pseudomonas sp. CM25]NQD74274.1 glycosyltransferase family 4 protein [Pseudomonas sp. CM27]
MMLLWLLPAILILSLVLTAGLRRYALARSVIDVPNARSSHTVPTPRGGGVAIVLTFLLGVVGLMPSGVEQISTLLALGGGGALIAVIGFMDDHGHIAARWRLLGHFVAAAWMLGWLGGLPPLMMFGWTLDMGWLGGLLASVYLVWLLNLYNFMDGIDGIASVEAITACLGAAWLYWLSGLGATAVLPLLLAAAVAGFLYWNFPPAKIFMGDAGSGFIGIVLGGLSLQAAWVSPPMFWCWLILLGVFIVDATYTLVRRLLRGDKVYEAHRSHAYQFASRAYGKHLPVTVAVAALNVCWLLPIAYCVARLGLDGALGVVLAYIPLIVLAVRFRAGDLEN